jgi:S1-C subfamily serine protease
MSIRQSLILHRFVASCSRLGRTVSVGLFLTLLPTMLGQTVLTTAQIAQKVSPSVVVIQGKSDSGDVLGSGFIVSKEGKIVTNLHVIRDMKTASVQLASGQIFDSVSVLATDPRRDLAILQIPGFDLPVLDLGNSDALNIGEPLVIVGSPRGLDGTVTAGILSSVRDGGDGYTVLQTDAAVNPGNSGGPLLNSKGQAIGVVSFQLRSAQGLNFAVPINYVRGLLTSLHQPMSLEQMQISLGKAAGQQRNKPSLAETLDWLKEKLTVVNVTYQVVQSSKKRKNTFSVIEHSAPMKFDSCRVEFNSESSWTIRDNVVLYSQIFTVPLGALNEWDVQLQDHMDDQNMTFVAGKEPVYALLLRSNSPELSVRSYGKSLTDITPLTVKNVDYAFLKFNDESLARRVAEAFHHASDLCRKKEAF